MLSTAKAVRRLRKIADYIESTTPAPIVKAQTLRVAVRFPGAEGEPVTMYQYVLKVGETLTFELPPLKTTAWLVEVE